MTLQHLHHHALRSKYICIDHFDKKYYSNIDGKKKYLRRNAVPEPHWLPRVDRSATPSPTPSLDSPEFQVLKPSKVYAKKIKREDAKMTVKEDRKPQNSRTNDEDTLNYMRAKKRQRFKQKSRIGEREPATTMGTLQEKTMVKCEFCEESFNNKYTLLVHNAKHIIIPLWRQKYEQCPECLHHFTSLETLKSHISNKHNTIHVPDPLSTVRDEPTIFERTEVKSKEPRISTEVSSKELTLSTEVSSNKTTFFESTRASNKQHITINVPDPLSTVKEEPTIFERTEVSSKEPTISTEVSSKDPTISTEVSSKKTTIFESTRASREEMIIFKRRLCEKREPRIFEEMPVMVSRNKPKINKSTKVGSKTPTIFDSTNVNRDEPRIFEDLPTETSSKEPEIFNETRIFEDTHTQVSSLSSNESLLESLVKREPITVLMKEDFGINNRSDDNDIMDDKSDNNDILNNGSDVNDIVYEISDDSNSVIVKSEVDDVIIKSEVTENNDTDNEYDNGNSKLFKYGGGNNEKPRIKDRLRFEDEDEDNILTHGLISDLTTDCKVKLETFDDDWINSLNKDPEGNTDSNKSDDVFKNNTIVLGSKPIVEESDECESIHYDELIAPGEFHCKWCYEKFPNRYSLLLHQPQHLAMRRLRPPLLCRHCDWYIATGPVGLHRHIWSRHGGAPQRRVTSRCDRCGLPYALLRRHLANYHQLSMCTQCDEILDSVQDLKDHMRTHHPAQELGLSGQGEEWLSKTVHACDLCSLFLRNKSNAHYEDVGELNEVGHRHICERCQKSFFSLKIIRIRTKKHKMKAIAFEPAGPLSKKKNYSNSERLKNVQMRLKKLKSLNKF